MNEKKYQKSLFIFRRDLRIEDNTGLIEACKSSKKVIPCFIFEPRLLENNPKFSNFRINFLFECLLDLQKQLKKEKSSLHFFKGNSEQIIEKLIHLIRVDSIFVNKDYTPFSKKRDEIIRKNCRKYNVDFISADDLLLHNLDEIKTMKGEPYKIFTKFYSKAKELPIRKPQNYQFSNLSNQKIDSEITFDMIKSYYGKNDQKSSIKGGRKSGLLLLDNLKNKKNYDSERNIPSTNGTSMLSAHNSFGTISIREVYDKILHELGSKHTLLTELHWRDFFTYIMYHYPYSFSKEFHKKYQKIPWNKKKSTFLRWCEGKTGFPIVDAGMRELNSTGFMHNRVRMIVASFLTKDLHIDWRWGEQYFASKLIDYDPSVNIGNWQWSASTGCDAQPWFRIFNPWLQQQKF